MQQALRIVFAGTPDFAALHLQALVESHHKVVAVYSQPDRPAGRGKKLTASPVKELALTYQLPVYQPLNFKSQETIAEFASLFRDLNADVLVADVLVVVAYGLLLPKAILDIPRLGCINVHASLLPRWRGAAPIQRAIEAGDTTTGVTLMQMDVGLDTGDMLLKVSCDIEPTDTSASLQQKLVQIGAPALVKVLDQLAIGSCQPQAQDDSHACYAKKLSKEEAALNWQLSAIELERKIRAFNPFPIAYTQLLNSDSLVETNSQERIRVWAAEAVAESSHATPGSITRIDNTGVWVACACGQLVLQELQLPGKKILSVDEIIRGHPHLFILGAQLEQPQC